MSDRKVFTDSITPLPAQAGVTPEGFRVNADAAATDETLDVHFALAVAPDAEAKLEQRVANGEVVTPEELNKIYSAPTANVDALTTWLKANGYTITHTAQDGIYAQAKASQISKSLEVNMVSVTNRGITYLSAQNAPSLPSDVGQAVVSITGLQPHRQFNKHFLKMPGGHLGAVTPESAAAGPAPAISNAPPYLASEITKAYNAQGIGDGSGQTVAILIDTFPLESDLKAFWTRNGLNIQPAQIQKINVTGAALPAPSGEETLDVSWSSGVAPGATIRVYATGSLSFVAIDRALDQIIADAPLHPGMRQLSISLGLGETFMSPAEVNTEHAKFLRLAALGINTFVSSGDAGSNPDATGHSPTGPLQAEYESSDASVISVGGTSLRLNASGGVAGETGWNSSGGGTSRFFKRPTWQVGTGVPHGTMRVVPDVSCVADPNTGAFLVLNGNTIQIGGTSWSAPVWAGFCALINAARLKAGKAPLAFANPAFYKLLGTAAFRDVVTGSNGAFHCGAGYDQVTGIGVPNVKELLARLP